MLQDNPCLSGKQMKMCCGRVLLWVSEVSSNFAPFMNIVIGLFHLDTSATLIERIKVCGKKEKLQEK